MRNLILTAAALLVLASARPAWAVSQQAGTAGAQFLKLGAGARAGGMADSFAAIADDADAAYYNPAGLTQLQGTQLAGAHTQLFQGISYEAVDFAVPFGREEGYSRHALAVGIYYLSVGDIERRTSDSTDRVGTFGASDAAYALSYAHAFGRSLGLGLTGKYIAQSIDSYSARSYSADAGVLYHLNPEGDRPLSLAAVVKNMGGKSEGFVAGNSDQLPLSMTAGAAWRLVPKKFVLDLEAAKYRDSGLFGSLGGEYTHAFNDNVSGGLRFGYSTQRKDIDGLNGIALGGGLNLRKASFDFAWQPFGVLGNTFRYSLLIRF
ncbi:MAG: PorV/PorQ family protein [Elusimicrobia bacterium]|nr:PorV/PorQ family protein [Elusimicrobiota bacterium]